MQTRLTSKLSFLNVHNNNFIEVGFLVNFDESLFIFIF